MFLKAKIVVIFILNTKVLETHIANLMIFKIEVYIKKFFYFLKFLNIWKQIHVQASIF